MVSPWVVPQVLVGGAGGGHAVCGFLLDVYVNVNVNYDRKTG